MLVALLRSLGRHLVGFLRFDRATCAALQADPQTDPRPLLEALVVVLVASVAAGIGAVGWPAPPALLKTAILGELAQWAGGVALAYFLGITLFPPPRTAPFTQTLPLFGFAQAPKAIGLLGLLPGVGPIPGFVGLGLFVCYVIVALRAALGFDWLRAIVNGVSGVVLAYALLLGAFLTTPSVNAAMFGVARPFVVRLPKLTSSASPAISLGRPAVKPPGAAPGGTLPHPHPGQSARPTPTPKPAPTPRPAPTRPHPGLHRRATPAGGSR